MQSQLGNWPVELKLVPVQAPHYAGARLLISADCVPFAEANFHSRYLRGRVLLVGCPKLDDTQFYAEKLATIFAGNEIASIEVLFMEVPCCNGLVATVQQALAACGKRIPAEMIRIGIQGGELGRAIL